MLHETTNFFATPIKKADATQPAEPSSSRLRDRKDKRKRSTLVDIASIRRAIDFSKLEEKTELRKPKLVSGETKGRGGKTSSSGVINLR